MDRAAAVAYQAEHFPNSMLPDICLRLRMQYTGASDKWGWEKTWKVREMLRARLDEWKEGEHGFQAVDALIRLLVAQTLNDVDGWEGP